MGQKTTFLVCALTHNICTHHERPHVKHFFILLILVVLSKYFTRCISGTAWSCTLIFSLKVDPGLNWCILGSVRFWVRGSIFGVKKTVFFVLYCVKITSFNSKRFQRYGAYKICYQKRSFLPQKWSPLTQNG